MILHLESNHLGRIVFISSAYTYVYFTYVLEAYQLFFIFRIPKVLRLMVLLNGIVTFEVHIWKDREWNAATFR